jgi:hypothetical protein
MSRRRAAISAQATAPQTAPGESRLRRWRRRVVQRLAVLLALLILFYATSLHGISSRTFILVGVLVLFLYWVFKGVL